VNQVKLLIAARLRKLCQRDVRYVRVVKGIAGIRTPVRQAAALK